MNFISANNKLLFSKLNTEETFCLGVPRLRNYNPNEILMYACKAPLIIEFRMGQMTEQFSDKNQTTHTHFIAGDTYSHYNNIRSLLVLL